MADSLGKFVLVLMGTLLSVQLGVMLCFLWREPLLLGIGETLEGRERNREGLLWRLQRLALKRALIFVYISFYICTYIKRLWCFPVSWNKSLTTVAQLLYIHVCFDDYRFLLCCYVLAVSESVHCLPSSTRHRFFLCEMCWVYSDCYHPEYLVPN